jgi:hypothetical protein
MQKVYLLRLMPVYVGLEQPWTKELKDTIPLISSLLVIFDWGGKAIL